MEQIINLRNSQITHLQVIKPQQPWMISWWSYLQGKVYIISTRSDYGYVSFQRDVLVKLTTCALCLLVYLTFHRICPVDRVVEDPYFTSQPFYLRILYLYLSMLSLRPKYYFVWTLGEWGSRCTLDQKFVIALQVMCSMLWWCSAALLCPKEEVFIKKLYYNMCMLYYTVVVFIKWWGGGRWQGMLL